MGKWKISRTEEVEKQIREIIGRPQVPNIANASAKRLSPSPSKCQKTVHKQKVKNTANLLDGTKKGSFRTSNGRRCIETETYSEQKSENSIKLINYEFRPKKSHQNYKQSGRVNLTNHHGTDVTNPIYHAPLNCGWKRELVHRLDGNQMDVYYWPPRNKEIEGRQLTKLHADKLNTNHDEKKSNRLISKLKKCNLGPKLRSYTEVAKYLGVFYTKRELTIDNFTFTKKPLGINDPDKEIVRDAVDRFAKEEELKNPPRRELPLRPSKVNSAILPIVKASNENFVSCESSSLSKTRSKPSQKVAKKTPSLELGTLTKNTTIETSHSVSTKEIRSNQVSTSAESVPTTFHQDLTTVENRISSSVTLPPSSSESSKRLRSRAHRPLYDEKQIMKKFRSKPVTNSPRRKSHGGDPNRTKRRIKSSPTTPILCMVSSSVSDAPPTIPLTISSSENFHRSSMPLEVDPLALPDPESNLPSQTSSLRQSQLSDLQIEEQMTESQDQISSTLDLVNEDPNSEIREIKVEMLKGRDSVHINEECIEEIFQFKVFMREEDALDVEIRRFSIEFDATPIYPHLCNTLQSIFPSLKDKSFTLEWRDFEGDRISISSCMELKEAIKAMRHHKVMKFYLTVHNFDVLYDLDLNMKNIPLLHSALN